MCSKAITNIECSLLQRTQIFQDGSTILNISFPLSRIICVVHCNQSYLALFLVYIIAIACSVKIGVSINHDTPIPNKIRTS